MNTPRFGRFATFLSLWLGVAAGCGTEVEPLGDGALSLSWQVSPRGCEAAGVETVEVAIDGPSSRIERFDCEEEGALVDALEPGAYQVHVTGVDGGGQPIFEAPVQDVTVHADATTPTEHVRLTAKPGAVEVTWMFANGRVCGSNDVDHIEISVFDKLDYEIARERFPCDAGSGRIEGFTAGTYLVEAIGLSGRRADWRGLDTVSVERGEQAELEVVLEDE